MKTCLFSHKWQLKFFAGVYGYYECTKCGTRTYKKREGSDGYTPIHWLWLMDCANPRYTDNTGPH